MMKLLPPKLLPPAMSLVRTAKDLHQRVNEARQRIVALSKPSNIPTDAVSFLDPIDELCEEKPARFMQSTYYVVVAMFLSLILAAALVKVDIIVTGTGRIMTETPPIMLQAMDQAIIRDITVKAGDVVKKGQVLATLDPTFAKADLESLTGQQQTLQAQLHRLEAEFQGVPYVPSATPTPDEQLQLSVMAQRKLQYESQLRALDQQIEERKANIRTTQDHRASSEKQLKIARDVETMRETMMKKEIGSKLNFLEAQAARMRIEQSYQESGNRITGLNHELKSKEAERQAFMDQWRQQTLDSLVQTRTEEAKTSQALAKAALMNNMVVLMAPEDGVVLEVAKRSVGSVMKSAEPIITMVESDAKLVGDITINSSDIGYTQPGDEVVVKVDAFPFQRHGFMHGKLEYLSEESFSATGATDASGSGASLPKPTQQGSGAYHRGRVQLTDTHLDNMPAGGRLIPGMTMVAEVKVGKRSVLSYFLNPLTRVLGESIREP